VTFPDSAAPLQTDDLVRSMADEMHHSKDSQSPFLALELGMVSQFPVDYMHAVCLGVVRKLVSLWLGGPLQMRLGRLAVDTINGKLIGLKKSIPVEFQHKPRPISEYERCKATDFLMLLLYRGYTVLSGVYDNVLLLLVGMNMLLNSMLYLHYNDFSRELLEMWSWQQRLLCIYFIANTFVS